MYLHIEALQNFKKERLSSAFYLGYQKYTITVGNKQDFANEKQFPILFCLLVFITLFS